MEAEEDELLLIHRPTIDSNISIFDFYTSAYAQIKTPRTSQKKKKEVRLIGVDQYLDVYNDYRLLYEWFGDKKYLEGMQKVLNKMKTVYR